MDAISGHWHRGAGKELYYVESIGCTSNTGYGFDAEGIWHDRQAGWLGAEALATKKEIKSALIKEAERRGCIKDNSTGLFYLGTVNALYQTHTDSVGTVLFSNGYWAEIVEERPKSLENRDGDNEPEYNMGFVNSCDWKFEVPIKTERPTITISDINRNVLGKIHRTGERIWLEKDNEIIECESIEDCLTKI